MLYRANIEMADRCGEILSESRCAARISRKTMSEAMEVSEGTIRAWEEGQGSPTVLGMLEWFRITGRSFSKAMLEFFWPEIFKGLGGATSDEKIKTALGTYVEQIAEPGEVKKLHFLILGNHGSEWSGLLDMACAHEHTSLKCRCRTAEIIHTAYDINGANGNVAVVPGIESDEVFLKKAINAAKNAQSSGLNGYTLGDIFKDDHIISHMLEQARLDSGISRKDLAKALNKSERTIQNWENGFNPSFLDVCMWFGAVKKSAWAYTQSAIYNHDVNACDDYAEMCRKELLGYFADAPMSEIRKLCYIIMGEHGSNWHSLLEALFEYICLPLSQRVITARSVLMGYCIEEQSTEIIGVDNILPDIENLRRCIQLGTNAAKNGKPFYTIQNCPQAQ